MLCRNWTRLQEAVEQRAKCLMKLESCYVQANQKFALRMSTLFNLPPVYARGDYLYPHLRTPADGIPFIQREASAQEGRAEILVTEILGRMDGVNPLHRPSHRTGFKGFFGDRVDSAMYYAECFKKWDAEAIKLRRHSERSSPTKVAFITFESALSATLASQAVIHRRPFSIMTRMAPEPRDVYWPNCNCLAIC